MSEEMGVRVKRRLGTTGTSWCSVGGCTNPQRWHVRRIGLSRSSRFFCDKHASHIIEETDMEKSGEFHQAEGWTFQRLNDGSVRISNEKLRVAHVIPATEWASIVAHVAPQA